MTSRSRCIITLGISDAQPSDHPQRKRDFAPGIERMRTTLAAQGYDGGFMAWEREFPDGCPPHRQVPFAFKPYCFCEARAKGYRTILWMDASVCILQPLDRLFEWIEAKGYLLAQGTHSLGEYCSDASLPGLGLSREESFSIPCCSASVLGLDLGQAGAARFLEEWRAAADDGVTFHGPKWSGVRGWPATASTDPRVHGHRHDQSAASAIAWRHGMREWISLGELGLYLDNRRRSMPLIS